MFWSQLLLNEFLKFLSRNRKLVFWCYVYLSLEFLFLNKLIWVLDGLFPVLVFTFYWWLHLLDIFVLRGKEESVNYVCWFLDQTYLFNIIGEPEFVKSSLLVVNMKNKCFGFGELWYFELIESVGQNVSVTDRRVSWTLCCSSLIPGLSL